MLTRLLLVFIQDKTEVTAGEATCICHTKRDAAVPNISASESVEVDSLIIHIHSKQNKKTSTLKDRPDIEIPICNGLTARYQPSPSPASANKHQAEQLCPACAGMIHFLLPLSFSPQD